MCSSCVLQLVTTITHAQYIMPEIDKDEDVDDDDDDDDEVIIFPLTDLNDDSGNSSDTER